MMKGILLASLPALVFAIVSCGQNVGQAPSSQANASSSAVNPPAASVAAATTVASNLPRECQALLAALQTCSDRLDAANSPVAAQFRSALQQTRETLPAAASDPSLPAHCAESLRNQQATARELGC